MRPIADGKATLARVKGARVALACAVFSSACGAGRPAEDANRAALRLPVAPAADPTLKPARLVPLRPLDDEQNFGSEPGGGKRALVAGVRVVRLAGGGVESASDPLPALPSETTELPDRLGGGFLFVIGPKIYRSERWLAPLQLLYAAPLQPTRLFVGLDRVYVRLANNAYTAFDARTGSPMDLGPWPTSPEVTRYVAADGWRAAAIADLRGVVATFDAGAKWQSLSLPMQPTELRLVGSSIVAIGTDAEGTLQSYAIGPGGQVAHLQPEERGKTKPKSAPLDLEHAANKNPVVAAVLDGFPLEGGTALVARDGELQRVRIDDGVVLDRAPDAFPLKPARCHALSLSAPKSPVAFGFVCGVPHGATEIYAYDPRGGKLVTLRHFDAPRAVFSPSNGTLVVEGACDPDAEPVDIKKTEQDYCLMHKDRTWEDFVVNGDVGTERVVPLTDGRTAILSPPVADLATARLTIFDGKKPTTIPITFDDVTAPAKKKAASAKKKHDDDDDDDDDDRAEPDDDAITTAVLRSGTWLRGVEERAPGVLSAWVEHSGHYVGVEVNVNGHAKHGKYIAELGTALVSGRYGLGWAASRQGYETIDGGMTWTPIALPEPLESAGPSSGATSHGCGPLGCVLAGWIRVGWGVEEKSALDVTNETVRSVEVKYPESLALRCELATPKLAAASNDVAGPAQYNYYGYGGYYGRYPYYRYGAAPTTQDWSPFFTIDPPKLGTDDLGFSRPIDDAYERTDRSGQGRFSLSRLARLYAWGPKGIDWDVRGKFMVRFTSPFESSSSLHTTQTMPTPTFIAESTNFVAMGGGIQHPLQGLAVIAGDEPSHALLVVHRWGSGGSEPVLVEIEAERPPVIAHRLDSQPLGEIESAVRMSGHWYVATNEPSTFSTTIWDLENGVAREVARVPRTNSEASRNWTPRLARRADGRMLGVLVEGIPVTEGAAIPAHTWWPQLYALPIDPDTGTLQEPEKLGAANGANKSAHVCGPEDGGWVIDGRWPGGAISITGAGESSTIQASSNAGLLARYHVTPTSLCVEKISVSGYGETTGIGSLGKIDKPTADVSIFLDRARQSFRCVGNR